MECSSLASQINFFAAFDTFIIELVLEFSSLPVLILACKMCPKDIEATVFALLMSVSNAGAIISLQLGTLLTHWLGITENNFDNLWIMIITPSIFYLVPLTVLSQIKIDTPIEEEEEKKIVKEERQEGSKTSMMLELDDETLDDSIAYERAGKG